MCFIFSSDFDHGRWRLFVNVVHQLWIVACNPNTLASAIYKINFWMLDVRLWIVILIGLRWMWIYIYGGLKFDVIRRNLLSLSIWKKYIHVEVVTGMFLMTTMGFSLWDSTANSSTDTKTYSAGKICGYVANGSHYQALGGFALFSQVFRSKSIRIIIRISMIYQETGIQINITYCKTMIDRARFLICLTFDETLQHIFIAFLPWSKM